MYPTKEQRKTLDKWFAASRRTYNSLVETFPKVSDKASLKQLREIGLDTSKHPWMKDVPGEIRDANVRDFEKAKRTHWAKFKKMTKHDKAKSFNAKFKFRSRRHRQQSLEVRGRDWGRKRGSFSSLFGHDKMKSSEPLPLKVEAAFRVTKDRLGRYYFCIPVPVEKSCDVNGPVSFHGVAALDPGVRTFQTIYDADGLCVEWGKNDFCAILRLCKHADVLQGKICKARRRKNSLHKAWLRLLERIRNKVKESHRKLASWLCKNYRAVLIPTFDTSRMLVKTKRVFGSKTARSMATWSHYSFKESLKQKAELYPWVTVIEVGEAYTSKTCSECGEIHWNLGKSKVFTCPACEFEGDRDICAAKNILLRYLTQIQN